MYVFSTSVNNHIFIPHKTEENSLYPKCLFPKTTNETGWYPQWKPEELKYVFQLDSYWLEIRVRFLNFYYSINKILIDALAVFGLYLT